MSTSEMKLRLAKLRSFILVDISLLVHLCLFFCNGLSRGLERVCGRRVGAIVDLWLWLAMMPAMLSAKHVPFLHSRLSRLSLANRAKKHAALLPVPLYCLRRRRRGVSRMYCRGRIFRLEALASGRTHQSRSIRHPGHSHGKCHVLEQT